MRLLIRVVLFIVASTLVIYAILFLLGSGFPYEGDTQGNLFATAGIIVGIATMASVLFAAIAIFETGALRNDIEKGRNALLETQNNTLQKTFEIRQTMTRELRTIVLDFGTIAYEVFPNHDIAKTHEKLVDLQINIGLSLTTSESLYEAIDLLYRYRKKMLLRQQIDIYEKIEGLPSDNEREELKDLLRQRCRKVTNQL